MADLKAAALRRADEVAEASKNGRGVEDTEPERAEQEAPSPAPTDADAPPEDDRPRSSIATQLVEAGRARYRLGVSEEEEPFAVAHEGPNVARLMRGNRSLRNELGRAFFALNGRAAPGSALTDALNVIEGIAVNSEREDVHLRVARHGAGLVLDLGDEDGQAVVIEPGGWQLVPRSPVLFRRTRAMSAMTPPAKAGDLDQLRGLLNISDESWQLLVGWCVATLLDWLAHPILHFTGEQGTAKSTAARLVGALLDPSGAQLRRSPTDPRDWIAQASASWVVCLDNVSEIKPWLSDALCRAVTGDGSVDRTLYTNLDVTVTSFRRVVVLTSIEAGRIATDLAERLLPIDLERIADADRREDAEIAADFASKRAGILAGLLTLASRVLEALPGVRPHSLPRMADFGRLLAAVDDVTGWRSVLTYQERLRGAIRAVVDDDLVAQAVVALMATQPALDGTSTWTGTASKLLKALPTPDPRPRDWPATAKALGGVMTRLAPALVTVGIDVERGQRSNREQPLVMTRRLVRESLVTLSPAAPRPAVSRDNGARLPDEPPVTSDKVTSDSPTKPLATDPLREALREAGAAQIAADEEAAAQLDSIMQTLDLGREPEDDPAPPDAEPPPWLDEPDDAWAALGLDDEPAAEPPSEGEAVAQIEKFFAGTVEGADEPL